MVDNKITIRISVNGVETTVEGNINAPLHTLIARALEQTNNTGQSPDRWNLRDENGTILDLDKKIGDFGFPENILLYLDLKAGTAGEQLCNIC